MGEEIFVNGVRETVFALARLQDIEDTLRRIRADLERIPARKTEIENTLESAQKALAAARQDLDSAVKERRSLEQDIEACETRVRKYKEQTLAVKTNAEYKALTNQVAGERQRIEGLEERILLNLERADQLGKAIKERDAALSVEKQRVAAETADLDGERRRIEAEKKDREDELRELEASLDRAALALYRRVAGVRNGVGLALLDVETCRECGVRNRPQPVAEARNFERLVQCESCQRILFARPPKGDDAAAG